MPPLTQPAQSQVQQTSQVSIALCIVLVIVFSVLSSGGVYMFLWKSNVLSPTQTVITPSAVTTIPSAKSAEDTALLFVKEVTATSSKSVSATTVPALSLLLHDDMYKASLQHVTEVAQVPVSYSTTTSSLDTSGTAIAKDTLSVQVLVCYDSECYKAYHYFVTLVIENGVWAVAGVSTMAESRE